MEEGWKIFYIPCVNTCTEVVDKYKLRNRLVAPNCSVVCNKCDTYSVVNTKELTYAVDVSNKFNFLKEAELEYREKI